MAWEAGSVFLRLFGTFEDNEFKKFDQAVDRERAKTRVPIEQKLELDTEGFYKELAKVDAERQYLERRVSQTGKVVWSDLATGHFVSPPPVEAQRHAGVSEMGSIAGVRGKENVGSPDNPMTFTLEAGRLTPLGSRAAAIGFAGESGGAAGQAPGAAPSNVQTPVDTGGGADPEEIKRALIAAQDEFFTRLQREGGGIVGGRVQFPQQQVSPELQRSAVQYKQASEALSALQAEKDKATQPEDIKIGVNQSFLDRSIAFARTKVNAWRAEAEKPIEEKLDVDTAPAEAKLLAFEAMNKKITMDAKGAWHDVTGSYTAPPGPGFTAFPPGGDGGAGGPGGPGGPGDTGPPGPPGGDGGGGFRDPLHLFGYGRGGRGGRGGYRGRGLAGSLLFGAGFAGPFGHVGSALGLGPEHVLGVGAAVAGSAAGALGGAGAIGAGALGQLAVGGGSDALVIKSTIADTQTLSKSYEALDKAVLTYGAGSTQAKDAQRALNVQIEQLGGPNGIGVQAEMQLAKNTAALGDYWREQTQQARKAAADILEQVVKLGHDYVPKVANAAKDNLTIINTGIKPLFTWLEGPTGMGIFDHLENNFKKNLPVAVDTFVTTVQALLRTINQASDFTGGFTQKLDNLAHRWQSMSDEALHDNIAKLVSIFKDWEVVIKFTTLDLVGLFKAGSGEGTTLIVMLGHLLEKWNAWENSAKGSQFLQTFFKQREQEAIALFHVLGAFGQIYATIWAALQPLVPVVTMFIQEVAKGLQELSPLIKLVASALTTVLGFFVELGKNNQVIRDVLIVPLGLFLLSLKAFGWETTTKWLSTLTGGFISIGAAAKTSADEVAASAAKSEAAMRAEAATASSTAGQIGASERSVTGLGVLPGRGGSATGLGGSQATAQAERQATTSADAIEAMGLPRTAATFEKVAAGATSIWGKLSSVAGTVVGGLSRFAVPLADLAAGFFVMKDLVTGQGGITDRFRKLDQDLLGWTGIDFRSGKQAMQDALKMSPLPQLDQGLGGSQDPLNTLILRAQGKDTSRISVGGDSQQIAKIRSIADAFVAVNDKLKTLDVAKVDQLESSMQKLTKDPSLRQYLPILQDLLDKLRQSPQFKSDRINKEIADVIKQFQRLYGSFDPAKGKLIELQDDFNTVMRHIANTVGIHTKEGRMLIRENIDAMSNDLGKWVIHHRGQWRQAMAQMKSAIDVGMKDGAVTWREGLGTLLRDLSGLLKNGIIDWQTFLSRTHGIVDQGLGRLSNDWREKHGQMIADLQKKVADGELTWHEYYRQVSVLNKRFNTDSQDAMNQWGTDTYNSIVKTTKLSIPQAQALARDINRQLDTVHAPHIPVPTGIPHAINSVKDFKDAAVGALNDISGAASNMARNLGSALGGAGAALARGQMSLHNVDVEILTGAAAGRGRQTGGMITAKPGGQLYHVVEGGHDEMVLTTDPKHAPRQAGLVHEYLQRAPQVAQRVMGAVGLQAGGPVTPAHTTPTHGTPTAPSGSLHPASGQVKQLNQDVTKNMQNISKTTDDHLKKVYDTTNKRFSEVTHIHEKFGRDTTRHFFKTYGDKGGSGANASIEANVTKSWDDIHKTTTNKHNDVEKIHEKFSKDTTKLFYNTYEATGGSGANASMNQNITNTWKDIQKTTQTGSNAVTNINDTYQKKTKDSTNQFSKDMTKSYQGMAHGVGDAHAKLAESSGNILAKMDNATAKGVSQVFDELNKGLATLNVDKVKFSGDQNPGDAVEAAVKGVSGMVPFEGGGVLPGKEYGLADQMTLVDPTGVPRAKMAGDEAVFTRHQMPYVDAGLQMLGFGGSEDLWSRVNTPHGVPYASGGLMQNQTRPGPLRFFDKGGDLPYVFPYGPGLSQGRTDMGTDWVGAGNVAAIGNAHIISATTSDSGWPGGGFILYQLKDGPKAGAYIYLAENIQPEVSGGQDVTKGQVIAFARGSYPFTESGWAVSSGETLAHATTGYSEGEVTSAGQDFVNFIMGLAHGKLVGGGVFGGVAPTWTDIKAPVSHMKATPGKLADAALKKMTDAANKFGQSQVPSGGLTGGGLNVLVGPAPKGSLTWKVKAVQETDDLAGNSGGGAYGPLIGYSELGAPLGSGVGNALGHLPGMTQMYISANNKYIEAPLVDIGTGSQGGEWTSFPELVMGLYPKASTALGFAPDSSPWIVDIGRVDHQPLHPASGIPLNPPLPRERGGWLGSFARGGRMPSGVSAGEPMYRGKRKDKKRHPLANFALGGQLPDFQKGGRSKKKKPTLYTPAKPTKPKKTVVKKPPTLEKFIQDKVPGAAQFTLIDDQVSRLEDKYNRQEQLYTTYDQTLTEPELAVLMGIREQEWDLLWPEYKELPGIIEKIQQALLGHYAKGHWDAGHTAPKHAGHWVWKNVGKGKHKKRKRVWVRDKGPVAGIGAPTGPGGRGGRHPVYHPGPWQAGINQQVTKLTNEINHDEGEVDFMNKKLYEDKVAAAKVKHDIQQAALNVATDMVGKISKLYDHYMSNLGKIHDITDDIANLPPPQTRQDLGGLSGSDYAAAQSANHQIGITNTGIAHEKSQLSSKRSQVSNSNRAILGEIRKIELSKQRANATLKQAGLDAAWTYEMERLKIGEKIKLIKESIKDLKQKLKDETKLQQEYENALAALEIRLTGFVDPNDPNATKATSSESTGTSLIQEMGDIGQNVLSLIQEGGILPKKYLDQIKTIFTSHPYVGGHMVDETRPDLPINPPYGKPGIVITATGQEYVTSYDKKGKIHFKQIHPGKKTWVPTNKPPWGLGLDWPAGAGVPGYVNAAAALADFQAFQADRANLFSSFGSNFVPTGAQPFGNELQRAAGLSYYGAGAGAGSGVGGAAGPAFERGGYMPSAQRGGDTIFNIEQHFNGAPDPHTYSAGLRHELGALV